MPTSKWLKNLDSANHNEDGDVIFRNIGNNPHTPIDPKTGEVLVDTSNKASRIKVGEIINPIYDNMVLSNGRRVKDIVTRAVEMPLAGSAGAEHIESHKERQGMVEKYIGFMEDIINDPDYVFEDKIYENSLTIEKTIDNDVVMVVSLNFDEPYYTNTLITMWSGSAEQMERKYKKIGKLLYKKQKK